MRPRHEGNEIHILFKGSKQEKIIGMGLEIQGNALSEKQDLEAPLKWGEDERLILILVLHHLGRVF